ncbi:glycosyltransferase family 2 protein [Demequina soli]|uniref:glycosyltransferase family 2 protein n=1 Tax=Demequina soli TaxID=1638987 RepID=UPI0009E54C4A|nr:cellulose synthase catalytic subunit [Demequina soli]
MRSLDAAAPALPPDRASGPSPVMTLLVVVATLGILVYAAFLLNPANRGDVIPYALVISAETILVFHALLSMWTILAGQDPRDFAYHRARDGLFGRSASGDRTDWPLSLNGHRVTVDVFVTVYGEDVDVIHRTVAAAMALEGRHRVWVLDDGDSDEVRDLAGALGARYVRRLSSTGAKAGNINHALTLAKGELFVVFDADFVADPSFLHETVPFFVDPKVAFVQTPQVYGNLHTTISKGAGYMQTVFYRFIQPGRNRFNAAFCVGTNVVFRRAAIEDIGGMVTDSKSEDVWTSLHLHERGWRSVYLPIALAVGDAPETIEAYAKQQLRWATGGFEILLTHNPLSPRRTLTADQRIQYFVTATFYLCGITPLLLILVPPMEIYFDLRPVAISISVGQWILFYSGFYVMQIVLAWFTLGSFRWQTLTLATVSFPIYLKAFVNALTARDVGWQATGSRARRSSPFNYIVPQVLFLVFLALTSAVAVWRDWDNGVPTLATAWNVTNTVILAAFVGTAAREARALRKGRRLTPEPVALPEAPREPALVIARPAPLVDARVAAFAPVTVDDAGVTPAPTLTVVPSGRSAATAPAAAAAATSPAVPPAPHHHAPLTVPPVLLGRRARRELAS